MPYHPLQDVAQFANVKHVVDDAGNGRHLGGDDRGSTRAVPIGDLTPYSGNEMHENEGVRGLGFIRMISEANVGIRRH